MMFANKLLFLLSVLFLSGKTKSKRRKTKKGPIFKKPKVKKLGVVSTDNTKLR